MTKQELRNEILKIRKTISFEGNSESGHKICDRLISEFELENYDTFLLFYPLPGEISLLPLVNQLISIGKKVAFPKVNGDHIDFYIISDLDNDFQEGVFHVMEPITNERVSFQNALCLVPGLVFDTKFSRLGYGKGYYDRFLSSNPSVTAVGICANRFFRPEIPSADHDHKMDYICTETTIYKRR